MPKQKPKLIWLPQRYIDDLAELVRQGKYPDLNEAIRLAIRDLLSTELWQKRKP